MTANTGQVLMAAGYPVICRGKTVVKGKHELVTTYLLDPLNNRPALSLTPEQNLVSESHC